MRLLGVFCWLNKTMYTRSQAHSGYCMYLEISTALFPLSADWSLAGPPGQYQCGPQALSAQESSEQKPRLCLNLFCSLLKSWHNYHIHQVCHKLCLGLFYLASSSFNDFLLCVKQTNLNLKIKISEAGFLARLAPPLATVLGTHCHVKYPLTAGESYKWYEFQSSWTGSWGYNKYKWI